LPPAFAKKEDFFPCKSKRKRYNNGIVNYQGKIRVTDSDDNDLFVTEQFGDVAKITLVGTIRGSDIPGLQVAFEKEFKGKTKVFFDLNRVEYLCSSALGVLLSLSEQFKALGGTLLILQPSEEIHKLFRLLGFNNMFTFAKDDAEALKTLESE